MLVYKSSLILLVNTQKNSIYENFESKVVDLKSEFSKASKKITVEVKEIEKNYTT
jgi:hypothetical protein